MTSKEKQQTMLEDLINERNEACKLALCPWWTMELEQKIRDLKAEMGEK